MRRSSSLSHSPAGARSVLLLIAAVTALPEIVLTGADLGVWGSPVWRPLAYQWGGFWAGLWHGWQPNYTLQPLAMLALYPLLHAGLFHMLGNIAGLWVVGRVIVGRVGASGIVALWVAGALAGGFVFGLLATSSTAPMVGASGAVFALAGAWGWLDAQARPAGPRRWRRRVELAGVGIAVNLAMVFLTAGGIAWETHLGGALAGIMVATRYKGERVTP